jgi:hypothetical protein
MYTETMCLNAAWMMVSFMDVATPIYFTKGVAWTHGAAALIANHDGLRLCPDADELPQYHPLGFLDGDFNASFVRIPQSLPAPAQLHAAPVVATPSVILWAYFLFAVALVFIGRLLVQRSRAKAHGKIHLPDLEENAPGVGAKENMQDLSGTVLGAERFYKD